MLMEMDISKKKEMLSMGLFFIIALDRTKTFSLLSNFEYLYLFHFKYTSYTLPAIKTRPIELDFCYLKIVKFQFIFFHFELIQNLDIISFE